MKRFDSLPSFFRSMRDSIQQRLSLQLGLLLVLIITIVFSIVFDILFYKVKQHVHEVAINRTTQLLDNTVVHINGILEEAEVITNYMAVTTPKHLHPDSLLAFTRRGIIEHPFLTGLAISMEPYYFPEMGRYFSAYSLRQDDTITTVREGPFEYFEKIWYKSPRLMGAPCWVDAYDDYNEGTLSSKDILTSYCCPMRDANGKYVGSITTSLTLKWLSEAVRKIQPYPNSSAIMIGRTGVYLVHPDTSKLFKQTIFTDTVTKVHNDVANLGKAMIAGRSGMMQSSVNGQLSYIFYRPLERTGWSIALVCPESDIFGRYNSLLFTVWLIIGIGLLLLLLVCYQSVRKALRPLRQLDRQAGRIADGHFDEPLPPSPRMDSVGRLTNSFIKMQQSLSESVTNICQVNSELEQRNQELTQAYQLKMEANKQKTAFLENMSHQIRTPLNIISGFAQVLLSNLIEKEKEGEGSVGLLPREEVADICRRMESSAKTISHIASLFTASTGSVNLHAAHYTAFSCNDICREVISSINLSAPESVSLTWNTEVPDSLTVYTDREALRSILDELLDNANKFTRQGNIKLNCRQTNVNTVSFIVSNTGSFIPAEKRDRLFTQFAKLDSFSEGIGLGLSLYQHTARQLGGDLIYDDSFKEGTCFILNIPVQASQNSQA